MSREQAQAILLGMAAARLSLVSDNGIQPIGSQQGAKAALSNTIFIADCRIARRAALLGYCYQHHPKQLKILTQNYSNPAAAVGIAYLVKLALDDIPPQKWLSLLYEFTNGLSEDLEAALLRVGHVEGWANRQAALRHIANDGSPSEAAAVALYAIRQFPDEYAAALRLCEDSSRTVPTDTTCIVGAVSAARLGIDAVPINVIPPHHRARLLALGAKLAEKR